MRPSKFTTPKAYEIKRTSFCGFFLYVDERVYIPNPETELLVSLAVRHFQDRRLSSVHIIDVGIGSGNIAIALAKELPHAHILGTDISREALEVAKINIKDHNNQNIELMCTDLVTDVVTAPDLIVCNLPWGAPEYMLDSNSEEMLAYMPKVAVYPHGGVIGSYKKLAEQVLEKGWKTTILAEVGKIPKQLIQQEMNLGCAWEYLRLAPNYAALKIQFD